VKRPFSKGRPPEDHDARFIKVALPRLKKHWNTTGHVLDVGTGKSLRLAKLFSDVTAFDEKTPNCDIPEGIEYIQTDIESFEMDKKFSLIIIWAVLYQFPPEVQKKYMSKLLDMLTDDGVILIAEDHIREKRATRANSGEDYYYRFDSLSDDLEIVDKFHVFWNRVALLKLKKDPRA